MVLQVITPLAYSAKKTRNKTITVPAGVNGHLYYRNIVFQNKDGENMENNPTNYSVKTILVDTKGTNLWNADIQPNDANQRKCDSDFCATG